MFRELQTSTVSGRSVGSVQEEQVTLGGYLYKTLLTIYLDLFRLWLTNGKEPIT